MPQYVFTIVYTGSVKCNVFCTGVDEKVPAEIENSCQVIIQPFQIVQPWSVSTAQLCLLN